MGCAGIIAASHSDSIGYDTMLDHSYIFGIAPHALIRPVKIFGDTAEGPYWPIDDTVLSRAIRYARQNAEVLSNSWGYGDPYLDRDLLTQELANAADSGRGGKGSIIVFSSGNSAANGWTVGYPANLLVCFSVGAADLTDHRWSYSQAGPGLGVVAPSGNTCFAGDVWTLDQMDYDGFNPNLTFACKSTIAWNCPPNWQNDYNLDCHFGGTSAAAPIVASVAALLLSRDSMLTREQVYEILRRSAVTKFSWGSITPPDFDLGWGRVDAFRAVLSIAHGDINNDGFVADLSDLSALIAYLNNPAQKPFPSVRLGDWNCSGGAVDLTDLSLCIAWVTGSPNRVPPFKPCFKY